MPSKAPSIISGLLTFIILIAFGILSVFGQMLLLNGVSEGKGFNAMSISLICQSAGLLVAVILARWLPKLLITRFNLNTFLAVAIAVIIAIGLGGLNAFLSIILSIPLAGIK